MRTRASSIFYDLALAACCYIEIILRALFFRPGSMNSMDRDEQTTLAADRMTREILDAFDTQDERLRAVSDLCSATSSQERREVVLAIKEKALFRRLSDGRQ